jgi:hypothetical protein
MEPWQKQFFELIEQSLQQSEQLADQVAEAIAETVIDLDQAIETALIPMAELFIQADEILVAATEPLFQCLNPLLAEHPLCSGCRHYHGQTYGEEFLVCGMHPYGVPPEQLSCPDKALISLWPPE